MSKRAHNLVNGRQNTHQVEMILSIPLRLVNGLAEGEQHVLMTAGVLTALTLRQVIQTLAQRLGAEAIKDVKNGEKIGTRGEGRGVAFLPGMKDQAFQVLALAEIAQRIGLPLVECRVAADQ